MTPRLFRAAEVCEMTELQAYVLRSWEKEFPGIGVQRTPDGPRWYRQADVDQVRRIKQLVFGEGLTVGGARRKLEASGAMAAPDDEAAEMFDALDAGAKTKIASVRDGLKALQAMLDDKPGDFELQPPASDDSSGRQKATGKSLKPVSSVGRGSGSSVAMKKTAEIKRRRAGA